MSDWGGALFGSDGSNGTDGIDVAATAIDLTPNARTVLERRYLRRDADGVLAETPQELFARVARDVAAAEAQLWPGPEGERLRRQWAQVFFAEMCSLRFLPNSPTLMNAGAPLQQLSACFVLPLDDSMDAIFETLKQAAVIHKTGGGTGFDFSALRPAGDVVGTTSGVASGPVSFLEVFDSATEHVKQGGTRRGANMGILRVDHPDILGFIDAKRHGGIANFNLSVAVDDGFLRRVESGDSYPLVSPRTGEIVGSLDARDVFGRICASAWECGDPGMVFLNRMNSERTNPTKQLGRINATNPCGEQPLLPYESCNLGSLNLAGFADARGQLDFGLLRSGITTAVRFLDDVIERTRFPLPEIERRTRDGNRKIGLGVMGWADLLVTARIAYDSPAALDLADEVMSFIQAEADEASERLADERGCFGNWKGSAYEAQERPMRNATRTTIAPTGTISIIAGTSSGIEPLFALAYDRHVLDGAVLDEVDARLPAALAGEGIVGDAADAVLAYVRRTGGLHGVDGVPEPLRRVFATAHEITPEAHVRMQAAFQRHTDNGVSKTVNLAADATVADVEAVYRLAWELGCTGITVYRDGSKQAQVLNVGVTSAVAQPAATRPSGDGATSGAGRGSAADTNVVMLPVPPAAGRSPVAGPSPVGPMTAHPVSDVAAWPSAAAPVVPDAPPEALTGRGADRRAGSGTVPNGAGNLRSASSTGGVVLPDPVPDLPGGLPTRRHHVTTPLGTMNVFISELDGRPFEVFVVFGKAGSDLTAMSEAIGRLISLLLRARVPVELVVDQLRGIGGRQSVGFGEDRVFSVVDALAKLLERTYLPVGGSAGEAAPDAADNDPAVMPHDRSADAAPGRLAGAGDDPSVPGASLPGLGALRDACPDCHRFGIEYTEGCGHCAFCGFSTC